VARNVTEQEIDALLVREEGPRPTVATRDFKEPRQLAPADLEALRRPADAAGAACVIAFRSFLPVPVELQNVEVAEASLDSALHKSGDAVVTLLAETAQGQALLVLDQAGAALLAEIALGADAPEDWYVIGQFPGRTTAASDAMRARRGPTATPIQMGDGTTTLTRFKPE